METSDIIATVAAALAAGALFTAARTARDAKKSRKAAERSADASEAASIASQRSAAAAEHANALFEEARDHERREAARVRFRIERRSPQRFLLANGPTSVTNVRLTAPTGYVLKDPEAGEAMGPNGVRGFLAVGTNGARADAVEVHCDELEEPIVLVLPS